MYWQVYLHKTVLSAEFLLAKILERAREIYFPDQNYLLSQALKFYLVKKSQENISQDLIS
jgi:HD superfamily phosphohydrolase